VRLRGLGLGLDNAAPNPSGGNEREEISRYSNGSHWIARAKRSLPSWAAEETGKTAHRPSRPSQESRPESERARPATVISQAIVPRPRDCNVQNMHNNTSSVQFPTVRHLHGARSYGL